MLIDQNSKINFNNNHAINGIICSKANSSIKFMATCEVIFTDNSATEYGAAIYSIRNSHVLFMGNSKVTFSNNNYHASYIIQRFITFAEFGHGSIIYSKAHSHISFKGNSSVWFTNNRAHYGGAIYTRYNSHISFGENCSTWFISNVATFGGAIYSKIGSAKDVIYFEGNSKTVFSNNIAYISGGAVFSYSNISFKGNSSTLFNNNVAVNDDGGSIFSEHGHLSFKENSSTLFNGNTANVNGGTIFCSVHSYLSFKGSSYTMFTNNTSNYGGAVFSSNHILFQDHSMTFFINNIAHVDGGAVLTMNSISFKENSKAIFTDSTAGDSGGAIHCSDIFLKYTFINPFQRWLFSYTKIQRNYAGIQRYCNITFSNNSTVIFNKSKATVGATLYSTGKITAKENSTVLIDTLPAKWCNNTCLPLTGVHSDIVTVDSDGMVWCSNQEAIICLFKECDCVWDLEELVGNGAFQNKLVNITANVMTLSSNIELDIKNSISIIGYNNLTVICVNGGRLILVSGHLRIEGITWIHCGGYDGHLTPVILIQNSIYHRITLDIWKCSFQHSIAPVIVLNEEHFLIMGVNIYINHCNFMNNIEYRGHGAIIHFSQEYVYSSSNLAIIINNCNFSYNGAAKGVIYIKANFVTTVIFDHSNFHSNQDVPIYLSKRVNLYIYGKVFFENNTAENGAGIYISDHSTVTFDNSSAVKFNNNKAKNGTIYSKTGSRITFKANSEVTFNSNIAKQYGSAIYSFHNSCATFTGNTKVTFSNNTVFLSDTNHQFGGTVFSESYGDVLFEQNSTILFSNNIANFGSAIFHFIIPTSDSKTVQR